MMPMKELGWKALDLEGRWHGSIKAPEADGHLIATQLKVPGGVQADALNAKLTATEGLVTVRSTIEGLRIPGPGPALLQSSQPVIVLLQR